VPQTPQTETETRSNPTQDHERHHWLHAQQTQASHRKVSRSQDDLRNSEQAAAADTPNADARSIDSNGSTAAGDILRQTRPVLAWKITWNIYGCNEKHDIHVHARRQHTDAAVMKQLCGSVHDVKGALTEVVGESTTREHGKQYFKLQALHDEGNERDAT
jgi:hypothetical protein